MSASRDFTASTLPRSTGICWALRSRNPITGQPPQAGLAEEARPAAGLVDVVGEGERVEVRDVVGRHDDAALGREPVLAGPGPPGPDRHHRYDKHDRDTPPESEPALRHGRLLARLRRAAPPSPITCSEIMPARGRRSQAGSVRRSGWQDGGGRTVGQARGQDGTGGLGGGDPGQAAGRGQDAGCAVRVPAVPPRGSGAGDGRRHRRRGAGLRRRWPRCWWSPTTRWSRRAVARLGARAVPDVPDAGLNAAVRLRCRRGGRAGTGAPGGARRRPARACARSSWPRRCARQRPGRGRQLRAGRRRHRHRAADGRRRAYRWIPGSGVGSAAAHAGSRGDRGRSTRRLAGAAAGRGHRRRSAGGARPAVPAGTTAALLGDLDLTADRACAG